MRNAETCRASIASIVVMLPTAAAGSVRATARWIASRIFAGSPSVHTARSPVRLTL